MIRRMERRDRGEFIRLSELFYSSPAVLHPVPRTFHEEAFEEIMRSRDFADGYMLEADGAAVGYGLVAKSYSREAGGKVLWLEELFVLPAYRSSGLGRAFFAAVEAYAREEGFARIRLEVEGDNVRARALYERLGYAPLPYGQMVKQLRADGTQGDGTQGDSIQGDGK